MIVKAFAQAFDSLLAPLWKYVKKNLKNPGILG